MATKPVGIPPPPGLDEKVGSSTKDKILGGIGGFMSAGAGLDFSKTPLGQKIAKHHQARIDEAEMHHRNASIAAGAIATGRDPVTGEQLTPESTQKYQTQYEQAMAAYEKIVGVDKESKGALGKVRMVLDHVIQGRQQQRQGAQGQGQPAAAPAAAGTLGGGPTAPAAAGAGVGAAAAPAKGIPAPPQRMSPEQMATAYPSQQVQGEQEFGMYKRQQEMLHKFKMEEDEARAKATAAARAGGVAPRPVLGPALSVSNARLLAQQGRMFTDTTGALIDLSQLPESMGLKSIVRRNEEGKWETVYEPFSPNSKSITVGNETYAINPMDVEALTQGGGTALGPHNVPRTSTHAAPGIDPMTGAIGTVTSTTTTTPQTTGVRGRGGVPAPPRQQGQPIATPKAGGARPTTTATPAAGGKPQFIPFSAANTIRQGVIPVREGATQIFGDPSQPGLKSLKDFAPLFDDPQSRRRVGKALRLTLDGIQDNVESSGGLLEWMRIKAGLPQALADARARAMSSVKEKLTPQEQDAYNALMSSYGAVIGLRSLTKASAARFSIQRLEQELPLPGVNSTSSRDYYDQLSRLAEQVYNGTRMLPMPESEKAYYGQQVGELRKLKESPPPKLSPAAQQFLDRLK